MISAVSGGSSLPRDLLQWLDKLDLSYSVRNPKMDLSNGFIFAQILTRCYPEDKQQINILTYYNCQGKDKKFNNWEQLTKYLSKKKFKITKQQYQSIINMGPESAQLLLFRLYQFISGKTLNKDRRLASLLPLPQQPLYTKFTSSFTAKDRQLHRVVDLKQKQFRTKLMIEKQKNYINTQKFNTGLIEWLIQKKKRELEKQINEQKYTLRQKSKNTLNKQPKVQVKQIKLKCYNSSTSKQNYKQNDIIQNKGVLQFLTQSLSLLFKKFDIANDLRKIGVQIKDKDLQSTSIIQQVFNKCNQNDSKGNRKISEDTLIRILQQLKKNSQVNLIVDNVNGSFIDFRKFFSLFLTPLKIYDKQSQVFKSSLSVISKIAPGLLKRDPQSTEMAFEQLFLPKLLQIGQNEYKREAISKVCLHFIRAQSQNYYYFLTQKIKKIYISSIKTYISYLAHFLQIIPKTCQRISVNLWNQFLYYGFSSLNHAMPSTRANGAKIISLLFTEVEVASDQIINQKLQYLKKLIVDPWWEVRAQAIIIYNAILISKYKNISSQNSSNINSTLNTQTILNYILEIFKPNVSHNILRVGLIELSDLLNYEEPLCQRYLEILLNVGPPIRSDVLYTSTIRYGPVVYGANTFTYKLTGAPLSWNSIGIARFLYKHLESHKKQTMQKPHLQILYSTILRNENSGEVKDWLQIFTCFKSRIFKTLLDDELCHMGTSIIKQFLKIQLIHVEFVNSSKTEVAKTLSQLYIDVGQSQVKNNLLSFFEYLKASEPEYTYKLLKDFAQRQKNKYLSSNLVDFMNNLSRARRKNMYSQT